MHPGIESALAETPGTAMARFARERAVVPDLERRIRELERKNEAMELFAAAAAHELMEPLVAAEACATLLARALSDEVKDSQVHEDIEHLLRGASRMRIIVETLLHDARASDRPLERVPVDLARVAQESVELLEHEARAHGATIDVGPLPVVQGDAVLLTGVLRNLLLNALRYGPRENHIVRVRARRRSDRWRISVSSQGAPIAPHERRRIFEPFRRGQNERRSHGSGLGLAICRSVIARHDGEIGVQPIRGHGNCFYFTLPDLTLPD